MNNKKKSDLISCSSCHETMSVKKIWYVDPKLVELSDIINKGKKDNSMPFCDRCLKRAGYR